MVASNIYLTIYLSLYKIKKACQNLTQKESFSLLRPLCACPSISLTLAICVLQLWNKDCNSTLGLAKKGQTSSKSLQQNILFATFQTNKEKTPNPTASPPPPSQCVIAKRNHMGFQQSNPKYLKKSHVRAAFLSKEAPIYTKYYFSWVHVHGGMHGRKKLQDKSV